MTAGNGPSVASDAWLAAIIDGSFDAIISKDLDGVILSWNPAAERLYGFAAAEAIGAHISIIVPPERRDELDQVMERLRRGEAIPPFETRRRRRDGTVLNVLVTISPIRDAAGRVVAASAMARDITAQKLAADRLRARIAELDVIMDTVPAIIWVAHDPEAQRITGSRYAAERLRIPPGDEQSLTAPEPTRPTHFRVVRQGRELRPNDLPVQRAARGEEIRGEEMEVVFDDGTSFWELVNASPVRDADGSVIGAVGAAIDITERKRAEEQQKLLMAELDHRVKNVLATVQSVVRLTVGRTPQADVLAGRIRALATAHSLLAESRWRGADLRNLVKEQLRPYRKGTGGERPRLSGPAIMLSPKAAQALSLVLHELATNAAKYGALSVPAGSLSVRWDVRREEAPRLRLVWEESGGPPVQAPEQPGFGTRLIESTLAYDIGGTASLSYRPEGLLCEIELPLGAEALGTLSDAAAESADAPLGAPPAGQRVLVVEDEYLVAIEAARMVEAAGCEVLGPCAGLDEALALATRERLDGAVIDVNLGGETVAPLADLLRQRKVPYLFMTGYGQLDMLPEHLRSSAVLRKPVREGDLMQALAQLLGARGRSPVTAVDRMH